MGVVSETFFAALAAGMPSTEYPAFGDQPCRVGARPGKGAGNQFLVEAAHACSCEVASKVGGKRGLQVFEDGQVVGDGGRGQGIRTRGRWSPGRFPVVMPGRGPGTGADAVGRAGGVWLLLIITIEPMAWCRRFAKN